MRIICIIGKTASSKDTVATGLMEYGIQPIISYTSREKRPTETDGKEHFFVTSKKIREIVSDKSKLLGYMYNEKTGREYCATIDGLDKDETYSYIINPEAFYEMAGRIKDPSIIFSVIYCDLDENTIRKRAIGRGDDPEAVDARIEEERFEFNNFKDLFFPFGMDARTRVDENEPFDVMYRLDTSCDMETLKKRVHLIAMSMNLVKYTSDELNSILGGEKYRGKVRSN